MNSSAKNILLLLNIAINKHVQVFVNEVDWEQILKTAQKQGVRGLTFEALEVLKQNNSQCSSFPDRMTLMQWYAQTSFVEKMFAQHVAMAKDVVELWKNHGIKTIVFKGLAHSRYYPKPEHREFGDFDCFLIDSHGKCAYKQGNDIARKASLVVDDGWYKHSHIAYKN